MSIIQCCVEKIDPSRKRVCRSQKFKLAFNFFNLNTPCVELKMLIVFEISQLLEGVRSNPSGFGVFSEGTYLSFKDFEKSFLVFEKLYFQFSTIWIEAQFQLAGRCMHHRYRTKDSTLTKPNLYRKSRERPVREVSFIVRLD